jgi:hypothetical protein
MKIDIIQLRKMIREVMADLEEDAIFSRPEMLGLQPEKDIPGRTSHKLCKKCMNRHENESCPGDSDLGRNLSYSHKKSGDSEGRMTRSQLYKIGNYAQSLHDIIRDDDDLPEWVQSKIAVMDNDIGKIKHYIEYKLNRMKR